MELLKRILAESSQYTYELEDQDRFDRNKLEKVDYTNYHYDNHRMYFLVGEFGCSVIVEFEMYSEWSSDAMDYTYGSIKGTHTTSEGNIWVLDNFKIKKYQFTDSNGQDIANSENILKVSGGINALNTAVEQELMPFIEKIGSFLDSLPPDDD